MRLFEGEVGRWFVVECLPPYLLVAVIVPLSIFWKAPGDDASHALLHVLGAGDLLAVNFCLILSALGVLLSKRSTAVSSGFVKTYYFEAQVIFLIVLMLVTYAAVKVVPVDAATNPARAVGYSALNAAISCWATSLIYGLKVREDA